LIFSSLLISQFRIASYYEKLRANGSSICALASKPGDNPDIRGFDIG
jgi:hypothetical protein